MGIKIHPTAIIEGEVNIGEGTAIWSNCHIRRGAQIGANCIIGNGTYIDTKVVVGSCVKIQNYATLYRGLVIEDEVFIGPHVCFTNDLYPRSTLLDGRMKKQENWTLSPTLIKKGCSIGANSTIIAGIEVGQWSMIGAGSVITKSLPPYSLAYGNPAAICGIVSPSGTVVSRIYSPGEYADTTTGYIVKIESQWC